MSSTVVLRSLSVAVLVGLYFAAVPKGFADTFGINSIGNFTAQITTTAPGPISYSDSGSPTTRSYMSADEGYFLMFGPGIVTKQGGSSNGGSSSLGGGTPGGWSPAVPATFLPGTMTTPGTMTIGDGPGVLNGNGENGLAYHLAGPSGSSSAPAFGLNGGNSYNSTTLLEQQGGGGGLAQNPVVVNPEPSSLILFGTGLLGVGLWCYRSKRRV